MNRKFFVVPLVTLFCVFILASCYEKKYSPTKGEIKAASDESLFRLISEAKNEFVSAYTETKIDLKMSAAREGIPELFDGKIQLYVCGRGFNDEELAYIEKSRKKDLIRQYKFCYDGIVLTVQKSDAKENISIKDLKKMLNGEDKSYKVYMPPFKSSTYEYIKTSLLEGKDPVNVKLMESESAVLDEVKKTSKSLGLVGLNVIADSSSFKFLKVCTDETSLGGPEYFEPHQGFLVNGSYPLSKSCFIFTNEIVTSVAGGFATFLMGNEGQKLVLKQKLGPATVPVRLKHK